MPFIKWLHFHALFSTCLLCSTTKLWHVIYHAVLYTCFKVVGRWWWPCLMKSGLTWPPFYLRVLLTPLFVPKPVTRWVSKYSHSRLSTCAQPIIVWFVCSTRAVHSKSCIRKTGLFQAIFLRAEKAIGDAHEASEPCECERRPKRVYTNIARYVCGVFGGVKQCKGDELAILAEGKKKAKDAWKRRFHQKLRILSFPTTSYEPP